SGGVASTAVAADDDTSNFDNNVRILSCDTIEIVNPVILAGDTNNIDCSKNNKEVEEKEIHVVDDNDNTATTNFLLKKHGK
ncbi:hypothetical protein NGM37_42555, partial [Streptomyces sp. TRM76130]|nr:hypothetical protein [Streptomyces sp. TRM76130]